MRTSTCPTVTYGGDGSSFVITFGEPMNGSTAQQVIQAEWEAFAICKKKSPSYSREDGKIQRRFDS